MYEFTNEKDRKGDDYTFCYDCQNEYGSEDCNNCTYFENETI